MILMDDNFLFHEVSDREREEIKGQARGIMDSFSAKLSKIGKDVKEPLIERDKSEREESSEDECCEMDREIMFENAPNKNSDFIIAEKGGWK